MKASTLATLFALGALAQAAAADQGVIEEGKALAFDRTKGNCLACHTMEGGDSPGNIGPPLVQMQTRYPDKQALWDKLWDPTRSNPETIMPPFGRNYILSEDEFYKVVEYVWQL